MLDKIRENSRSIGTYIIFGILIVVFVAYFGPGSNGCVGMGQANKPTTYAARVDGTDISMATFNRAYQRTFAMYTQQMPKMTEQMAEQFHIKDTVLDQLVDQELMLKAAQKMGLSVDKKELAEKIRTMPVFQKDGHFDFPTYQSILGQNGFNPESFETGLKEDLLRQRLHTEIGASAAVTPQEIQDEYKKQNDTASLTFVQFNGSNYLKKANPTDAEVKAFLATEPGKQEVQAQYARESRKYNKPKRVAAQHILIKVAEDAPPAQVDEAMKKAEAAKKRIDSGEDFGAVAKAVSEDTSNKDKGGDLGTFGPGTMVKPFEDAAMAMEPGKVSDPVRTRFGFHIIKVNQVFAAEDTPLEKVQDELAKGILAKKASEVEAKKAAEAALADAKKTGKSLADLFPAAPPPPPGAPMAPPPEGVHSQETGTFNLGNGYIPKMGTIADLTKDLGAVSAPGALLPRTYESSGSTFVAQVKERSQPDMTKLADKENDIREMLLHKKQSALVDSYVKQLRAQAKIEKSPTLGATAGAAAPAFPEDDG